MAKDRLNFQYFLKYFLTISFPTHFWTLLMVFRDIEFVTERTDLGGTIGYAGYSVLLALVEGLIFSIIVWGLSLVIARKMDRDTIFTLLVSLFYVIAFASMLDMAAYVFDQVRISRQYLHGLENYTEITYGLIAGAVLVGWIISLLLVLKSAKAARVIREVLERIMLLSYLYLFLDAVGIIVIIWRNLA